MKKSWVSRFAGLVLVLTLITSSLVAGTYAKYVTTVTATDNVVVAKWSAELEDNGTTNTTYTTTFDLIGTLSDTGVNGSLLAPGTAGSFALDYDMTGTQVAHNITMKMDAADLLADLTYLKFYEDAAHETEIVVTSAAAIQLYNENFGTTGTTGSAVVYWAWPFSSGGAQDTADTADGITAGDFDVTVSFTATQLDEI